MNTWKLGYVWNVYGTGLANLACSLARLNLDSQMHNWLLRYGHFKVGGVWAVQK